MRGRRRKVWLLCIVLLCLCVYLCGWYQTLDEGFVELHTCPACYGQTLCPLMLQTGYSLGHKIQLTGYTSWKIFSFLNVKNVYYGQSGGHLVVLKKLAHDAELQQFNEKLCKAVRETQDCDTSRAIKTLLRRANNNVAQVVSRYPQLFEESDGVRCNHNGTIQHLYKNYIKIDTGPYQQEHFLTMLAVNMEPLILNAYQHKWFPSLWGTCGRVMVEDFVGLTLTQLSKVPWIVRADFARQLIEMAKEMTDGDIRLYLTDVSLDNFAVDDQRNVKIIDAENIVMVDPLTNGIEPTEHINDGFGCRDCLSFSYEDMCYHTSADHNFFAVCKGMLSSTAFSQDVPKGLLHTPPTWVMEEHPSLFSLVEDCGGHFGDPSSHSLPSRRKAAAALHSELVTILRKSNTMSR